MTFSLAILGFILTPTSIQVDFEKIKAISTWLTPTSLQDVQSFHGMASFYCRFVQNFSTIADPITDCIKKECFNEHLRQTTVLNY